MQTLYDKETEMPSETLWPQDHEDPDELDDAALPDDYYGEDDGLESEDEE